MSRWLTLPAILSITSVLLACSVDDADELESEILAATATPVELVPVGTLAPVQPGRPANWVYWLSDINLTEIAGLSPEAVVIDYSQDGGPDSEFSRSDITGLRNAMSDPGLVISYMSIGEADSYRYYWQSEWTSDKPGWLEKENPNWEGNYKVRYWDPEWQSIILGSASSYLDRIIAAGFDGVYLDIIDAYDYFAEQGRETAEDEMVAFVSDISQYAKSKRPGFLIFPQNAPELGARSDYMAVVDGIGMEGVYFGWEEPDRRTSAADTTWLEEQLARFIDAGKTVLAVDYASGKDDVADAYRLSRAHGFTPTVTDVNLAGLPCLELD